MRSIGNSGGMRSDPVLELARRGAVRLAAGGGAALSIASLLQIALGDSTGLVTLAAAVPTTALAVFMLRQEKPNVIALVSLIAGLALVAEMYAAVSGKTAYVAGVGGEVVVFGLGILAVFIARRRPVVVATGFLAAAVAIVIVAQTHLNGLSFEIVSDIVVVVAVLGTLMYLVIRVMESLSVSQSRFSDLARVMPVSVLELDVSAVVARIPWIGSRELHPQAHAVGLEDFSVAMDSVKLSYANDTAKALVASFGLWDDIVVGVNGRAVRTEGEKLLQELAAGVTTGAGELALGKRDGTDIDFIYRWSVGHGDQGLQPGRLVIAATDVTRLRNVEHALEQQLRERDQFVASVSHELRTPLTSIMGLTEELVARPADFDEAERLELLGIVAAETRDVVDIVEDLLVTARAEAGRLTVSLEPCDLALEVERVAEVMGGMKTDFASVWTSADPVRLRQVLRNLLSNAARHGGPSVRLRVTAEGDRAVFEIRDDGEPLAAPTSERIFLPYERSTDGDIVGSVGLGLHVARVLARLMGGDLTYEHDGQDTIFRLDLPRITASNRS